MTAWRSFRNWPIWVQVIGWLFLWWLLAFVWLWSSNLSLRVKIALTLVGVVGVIAIGATNDKKPEKRVVAFEASPAPTSTTRSATSTTSPTTTTTVVTARTLPPLEHLHANEEITMTKCGPDALGYVDIKGTARNTSSKTSDYRIEVKIEAVTGLLLGTEDGIAEAVDPRQTAVWSVSPFIDWQAGTKCRITKVERDAHL